MNRKLLLILLLFACYGYAQDQNLDSLGSRVFKNEKLQEVAPTGDTLEVRRLYELAQDYQYKDLDSMNAYAKQAKALADKLGFIKGQINSMFLMSIYLSEKGKIEDALKLMQESEDIARGSRDPYIENTCYVNIGVFYSYNSNLEMSNNYFLKVVSFGEEELENAARQNESPDKKIMENLSTAYVNLADNHKMVGYHEKALEYIDKADQVNLESELNDLVVGVTLANKAEIYLNLKRHEDALITVNEAIDLLKDIEATDWVAFAERINGDNFLEQGYSTLALEAYKRAKALQKELDDPRENAALDNAFAKAYFIENNLRLTKRYAKEALEKAQMLGEAWVAVQSAETLFKTYESEGDLPSALFYHKLFKKYSDSLFDDKNMKSIATLEAQQEIEKQKTESNLQNEKNQNKQRFLLLTSTGGALILLTVLFMTQRSRKLERKLNDLLTKKNKVMVRRERQLNWMNATKIKLFSIISHDLRAPLASLNNLIDLLNDEQIGPEEFIDFAPQLSDQVKNVSFTLNNLLLWSKQQMQGARNNPKKHNLHKLANQSIDLLMHQAKQKNIFVRNEIPAEAEIYADGDQITIVFRNLISNAIKFTNKDGAVIIKAVESDGSWEVEVKDTGVGMDQRTIEQLHSVSSFMESTYGTDNEKGTGIGLNLCKEMITKGGGEFRVKSAIGVGTSFFFTLEKFEEEVQEVQELPEPTNLLQ